MEAERQPITPDAVITEVAAAMPVQVRGSIVVVGSLASAYAFPRAGTARPVNTKDIDCVLSPHSIAVEHGRAVALALLEAGVATAKHRGVHATWQSNDA